MNNKLVLVLLSLLLVASIAVPRIAFGEKTNIVIAVDLAHGESSKYLNFIQGNITQVTIGEKTYIIQWINITTSITPDLLSNVDILLIGQPTVSFTPDEMEAIYNWLKKGNKALYIAGDSDYGAGPTSINVVNSLLEYIGAKLRLEQAAVYSEVNRTYNYKGIDYPTVAGAYYRVLAFVEPDNIPGLFTSMLDEGVTKPILMHGPTCVVWIDEEGNYRDPVNETYPGLIRIAWFRRGYIGDNQPPLPYVYDPLLYGLGGPMGDTSFVAYAAEYWPSLNVVITVAGESLYGDYEPAWASFYYGVSLDGPRFVTNLIRWWVRVITYQKNLVLSFNDPEGDDNGPGTFKYPTNPVFKPGVFDIVKFEVFMDDEYIYLRTTFRDLGGNPWGGPNGYSLQLIHVYMYTTNRALFTNTTAPGLNVKVYPGWHYLAVATPGWGDTPWPDGEVGALYSSDGKLISSEGDEYDVYALPEFNAVEMKIRKNLLTDVENIDNWLFAVAVTSYDGFGTYKVRAVQPGDPAEWALGGADSLAVLKGVQPLVIDFLAPTKEDQYMLLKSYDPDKGLLAVIGSMGIIGFVAPALPVTVTVTQTVTTPVTIVETQTQMITETETVTQTVLTTIPLTVTETVAPDYTLPTVIIVVLIVVIVGLAIIAFRKK
ncbi:MAG: glucodextranase DOMON-like domain-containing protein [Desulfurococcaceae archaeon]